MKATIDTNRQYYGDKMNKQESNPDKITAMVKKMIDQIQISNFSPDNRYLPKSQDTTAAVSDNKKSPPLKGGNSTKVGGMWNLKHDIRSPKLYQLLIKT